MGADLKAGERKGCEEVAERDKWKNHLVIMKEVYDYALRLFEKTKTSEGCSEAEIKALLGLVEILLTHSPSVEWLEV